MLIIYLFHNSQYPTYIISIFTGFIDDGAVQELLSECAKMKNFDNLHVMSLKGVCLDGGPVPYIILPYMANGSLASYLRKQRKDLVVMKETTSTTSNIESDPQSQVSLYITVCHVHITIIIVSYK